MRVVVIGASGFLGSWTVRALVEQGHLVTALVRAHSPWRIASLPEVEILVAPAEQWATEISRLRPDTLVSTDWAGVAVREREDPMQWANLGRQREVLHAAVQCGAQRVVGVGSQAEYGPRDQPIAENDQTNPVTVYGEAKLAALDVMPGGLRPIAWCNPGPDGRVAPMWGGRRVILGKTVQVFSEGVHAMTAPHVIDPARFLSEQLEQASPDRCGRC